MRLQPIEFKNGLASGRLGENNVGAAHGLLRRFAHSEGKPELSLHLLAERLGHLCVKSVAEGFRPVLHFGTRSRHGPCDHSCAQKGNLRVVSPKNITICSQSNPERTSSCFCILRSKVLDADCTSGPSAKIREVSILLENSQRKPVRRIDHNEYSRTVGEALFLVLLETDVRQLDGPGLRGVDVSSLDVTVSGSSNIALFDPDVHRNRHIDLALGKHSKRGLYRLYRVLLLDSRLNLLIAEELGCRHSSEWALDALP
mmetsp:Transcript_972/g.1785  ORF Transcript_972/g.1785 Transcript_972/m.1785 type:complete len:257 (+) Transcript_972:574-1344(+)